MNYFEIPDGFGASTTAIHVEEDAIASFLTTMKTLQYPVNIEYLHDWTTARIKEGNTVFFYVDVSKFIEAFTQQSEKYTSMKIVELNDCFHPESLNNFLDLI